MSTKNPKVLLSTFLAQTRQKPPNSLSGLHCDFLKHSAFSTKVPLKTTPTPARAEPWITVYRNIMCLWLALSERIFRFLLFMTTNIDVNT